ncbi:MAG: hypothetical protein AAGA48_07070 [Myxococcota bacterium]
MAIVSIIGAGRIGTALASRAEAAGQPVALITRTEGWDRLSTREGPILVAVRNDGLADVVARTPEARRADLVFLQNGAIRDRLAQLGVPDADRGLIYFLVAQRGGPVVGGQKSVFTGRHAAMVEHWFTSLGLAAEAVPREAFADWEWEKHVWIAAHGVLCPALDATVGEIGTTHRGHLDTLVEEWAALGIAEWNVRTPPPALVERLVMYSAEISDYKPSFKAYEDRNGWFIAVAAKHGLPADRHVAWLERVDPALGDRARAELKTLGR